jgi:hypothetical protein
MKNNKIIKDQKPVSGNLVTLIQTDKDKKYSLKNNVIKFSAIEYKGEIITDHIQIEKIIGHEK